jgi:hypothetical protein
MTTRSANDNAKPASSELNINMGHVQLYDMSRLAMGWQFDPVLQDGQIGVDWIR